jgi:thiosulfate/3-mercaptopyruvate sulfurtransferase
VAQLITPAGLDDLLRSGTVRVLDVRYRLDRPDGCPEHLEGHVPGAVYVDMETELSQHGRPEDGRHPLPSTESLQAAARRWGLRDGAASGSGMPRACVRCSPVWASPRT